MIYVPGAPAWFEGELAFDPGEERHLNEFDVWFIALLYAEWAYMTLIDQFGRSPQEARSVLPNSLRTEIVVTFNLRQWRYFLRLRSSPACHPQMREVVVPLLAAFRKEMPAIFEDIPLPEDASQFLEG
jgi:thymidylate synthase (FAD)